MLVSAPCSLVKQLQLKVYSVSVAFASQVRTPHPSEEPCLVLSAISEPSEEPDAGPTAVPAKRKAHGEPSQKNKRVSALVNDEGVSS